MTASDSSPVEGKDSTDWKVTLEVPEDVLEEARWEAELPIGDSDVEGHILDRLTIELEYEEKDEEE